MVKKLLSLILAGCLLFTACGTVEAQEQSAAQVPRYALLNTKIWGNSERMRMLNEGEDLDRVIALVEKMTPLEKEPEQLDGGQGINLDYFDGKKIRQFSMADGGHIYEFSATGSRSFYTLSEDDYTEFEHILWGNPPMTVYVEQDNVNGTLSRAFFTDDAAFRKKVLDLLYELDEYVYDDGKGFVPAEKHYFEKDRVIVTFYGGIEGYHRYAVDSEGAEDLRARVVNDPRYSSDYYGSSPEFYESLVTLIDKQYAIVSKAGKSMGASQNP